MKILALSDIHGNGNAFYKAMKWIEEHGVEVVVIAGDITHFGPIEWAEKFVRSIIDLGVEVLGIPGNCDPPEVEGAIERGGGISIHEKRVNVKGLSFAGVGGSNPTPFPTLYERDELEMAKAVDGILKDLDVFVSHAPPLGKNDKVRTGVHVGNEELARILDQWKPRAVLTGHIHECRGIIDDKGIVYMNPGPAVDGHGGLLDIDRDGKPVASLL